jgi:hypothetical protein
MKESGTNQQRIEIQYFDGINSSVQQTIARRSELSHAENARAPVIGVLEKREGQTVIGTDTGGVRFDATNNYGLVYFEDGGTASKGLIRISSKNGVVANIYYLNQSDVWTVIDNDLALSLSLATCDFAKVDDSLIIVNGTDVNRMITGAIGTATPMETSTTAGSLYNSPKANKVAFYKSRIYLADYYDDAGNELKTTILRSSYALGIVSLLSGDVSAVDANNNWILPVVDTKYFYTDSGMNIYEIYRGNTKIAQIWLNAITETSISAPNGHVTFETGYSSFLSSDEVWISGTFTGEKKYRWVDNSSSTGRDVKQYDTFKLVGGDEDAITLFEPIGNILMIANRNAVMTWNDYTLENFDMGVGCCSKNGYVKLKGSLYFLHYSGVYATTGGIPQLISRKIERYITGATKAGIEGAAAGYKGLNIFFTIGDVTLYNDDGSFWKTLSDVCLEFDITDQDWYIHTNVTATQLETYIQTSGAERLCMCSVTSAKDEVLGAELITNGSFTGNATGWTLGTGWAYGSNNATFTS